MPAIILDTRNTNAFNSLLNIITRMFSPMYPKLNSLSHHSVNQTRNLGLIRLHPTPHLAQHTFTASEYKYSLIILITWRLQLTVDR